LEVFIMRTGRPSTITASQREEFWRRYKAGESVLGIIGALRQRGANVHRLLEASDGIAPVPRTRSPRVLRFGEREEISRGLAAGDSFRVIARRLSRAVSTGTVLGVMGSMGAGFSAVRMLDGNSLVGNPAVARTVGSVLVATVFFAAVVAGLIFEVFAVLVVVFMLRLLVNDWITHLICRI
jgi:hypothetical protein